VMILELSLRWATSASARVSKNLEVLARFAPFAQNGHQSMRQDIADGLRLVGRSPLLLALTGISATWNLSGGVLFAVYVLYLTRELGVAPGLYGLIVASGNLGVLFGSLVAGRVERRLGPGPTISLALGLGALGWLFVPLASGSLLLVVPSLVGGQIVGSLGLTVFAINAVSLRQAVTPDGLRGRVAATMRFVGWGTSPRT
jgi:MFS family permease